MKKTIFTLLAAGLSIASFASGTIVGTPGACVGSSSHLSDTLSSTGVWSSSNPAIATVDASGNVTGLSGGTANITFTYGSLGTYDVTVFTVTPAPAAIAGGPSGTLCSGSSTTFTDATPGGTWSSSPTIIASINATTGVATGGTYTGTANIYYTVGVGCSATATLSVTAPTAYDSISGPSSVCAGSTITLTPVSTTGGTWTSSNTAVATIDAATGVVTGVGAGTSNITYALASTCGTTYGYYTVFVSSTTSPGAISGTATMYVGASVNLYETVGGGAWSSSTTGVATVNSMGTVTGVAAGTATISYTVTGCSGAATATYVVTVNAANGISGHVLFSSAYYGNVKVWLINYNPGTHILSAVDSMSVYCSGTSAEYHFYGVATDSFRMKAAAQDTFYLSTGFVPTYHTSSFYWHDATVLYHVSGTDDVNQDINMIAGVPTTGPGFIGGDVTTGANKGTSGSIPVQGLTMYAVNSTTSTLVQQARTDASGNYSFSNLPVGTYLVFPDSLNYLTTPFTSITLTSSSATMSVASFTQHTVSKTITPNTTAISNVNPANASISAFPNPSNGKLHIVWNTPVAATGTIIISDVAGRQVYSSAVNMTQGAGMQQVDLSSLNNGMYLISIKAGAISYDNKLTIQH